MSVGFRKSLFGFNCDDVMSYIENTHKSFKNKETELEDRVSSLSEKLSLSKEDCAKLSAENSQIAAKLNEFNEKYDEIERLSENIGKLYLVAQANARAIMSGTDENVRISEAEVNRNINSIDEAHESLDGLRASIIKTSEEFVGEVDRLIESLTDTKDKIRLNCDDAERRKKEFAEVYESITK